MNNLSGDLTYLRTFQDLIKKVGKVSTSCHPANLYLATGHCFMNGMVADRKMILLESLFRHGDTLDQQIIVYIHVSGSLDSHAKHPNLVGQGFDLFT